MTETELKNAIIELAGWTGWLVHHDLPALDKRGAWRTHVQGDVGFPDLLMLHPRKGKMLVAELKGDKGKTTPEQDSWLSAFRAAGIAAEVWRPKDWDAIRASLQV